jgi:hypothetical protein
MNYMRLIGIMVMFSWAIHTQAQVLVWSATNVLQESVAPGEPWEIALDDEPDSFNSGYVWLPPSVTATRLFVMTLYTNDTGWTFFANAANEPGFAGFVANLTDGTNQNIRFQSDHSSYTSLREEGFLGRSLLAPDLAGYNITRIGFRVESFYDTFGWEDEWYRTLVYSLNFYTGPLGPQPAAARLALRAEPGAVSATVTGTAGAFYSLQYADALTTTNWITWTNVYLPSASFTLFHQRANSAARFYRAVGLQ